MGAAAAACMDLQGLSRANGSYQQPVSTILHFFVGGALNSRKIRGRRIGVNGVWRSGFMSGGVIRISEFARRNLAIQSESYKHVNCRRLLSGELDNPDRGRRCLTPPAAVATGAGEWESWWEGGVKNRKDVLRCWDLKPTSSLERLAFLGILALAGLAAIRVLKGSSLLSVGAIILFICLGGFQHRFTPVIFILGEKLQYLKGSFVRAARLTPMKFKEHKSRTTAGSRFYNLSVSSLSAQTSRLANGSGSLFIDFEGASKCVNHLTSIIDKLDSVVISGDVQSVNDLMKLQLGIAELREDLYRTASVLHAKESLLQSKLQSTAALDTRPISEQRNDGIAVQVPVHKDTVNFDSSSDDSRSSVSGELDLTSQQEGGYVVSVNLSGASDFQQGPQSSSNTTPALKEGLQAPTCLVITADHELETVAHFTPVALETQVFENELASSKVDGPASRLRAAPESLLDIKSSPERINSAELFADSIKEAPVETAEEFGRSAFDSIEMKTGSLLVGEETISEDKVFPSQPLIPVNRNNTEEPTPMYISTSGTEQSISVIVMDKASPDPWRDGVSESLFIGESVGFRWDTGVMQETLADAPSGRWRDDSKDSALYVNLPMRGVYNDCGGKGRGNAKSSVDFWGNNTANAGRAQRGTLTKIKATRRGTFGSVDNVDNELPHKRRGGWTDEQVRQGQVRGRYSGEGYAQPIMSGKQYVQDERDLWDYESVMDEPVSSRRSMKGPRNYEEDERDLDRRNVPAGDREGSYGGRGSQPRKTIDKVDRYTDGNYNSQERTRPKVPVKTRNDRQILYEEEEEEEYVDRSDARDLEDYSGTESRGLLPDDIGASQNGSDLGGNYYSQTRTGSSSKVPVNSRNRRQTVEDEDYEGEQEEDRYRKETRNMKQEGDEYDNGRKSWAESQNTGREVQKGSDYGSEPEVRSTDLPPYGQSEIEPEQRNLPVRQPSRMQLEKFDRLLDEGEALLEEGMQGLEGRIEVGVAERMLYEAANLFEEAAEINPSSLIAVGYWGNTLLVHGELKLKLSQQLRSMLPSSISSYSLTRARSGRDEQRESLEMTLQNVCEECEELLVDAGRKYRMALTVDRADMRALYNWGLALCYRGQLIAEEGGERAVQDADKVYLAAIDKFEAMLGLSQEYAGGALYNWGLAMRDRARLRQMGDRERVKLLLQAKELFEDAMRLDPNNGQARGAVAAAVAELQELQRFEERQSEQESDERPSRNWWR